MKQVFISISRPDGAEDLYKIDMIDSELSGQGLSQVVGNPWDISSYALSILRRDFPTEEIEMIVSGPNANPYLKRHSKPAWYA